MALFHRDASGEGQVVDASLFGGNMYSQSLDMQAYLAMRDDRFLEPVSRLDAGNPMSGPMYPSADGRWVTLAMPDTDKYWPAFAAIVGLDVNDSRFDSHEKRCEVNRLEMMQVLEECFRKHSGSHWKHQLEVNQLPADVIEKYDYPAADPAATANRYILDLDHPTHGKLQSLGFPIYMSDSPARLRSGAPFTGQHSAEILQDRLGYSEAEIETLEMSGTI
jgi:crotonobetainyl-CoA:carnitine CoA-transferase CaiB-like acyl-CoA transferase